ncbi:MAG: hypothetical protein HUJ63_08245 [Enterococcus sp.]|nr:hypothetical protein [Enterococcus sp.]
MKAIQNFCERYGWVVMGGALVFTLIFSLLLSLDVSKNDYLYYMHLVDNYDCSQDTMVVGTIFFSKPLWLLFGRNLWMWRIGAWLINCVTALIPFFLLLNKEQRHRYAYVMVLVIVVLNWRFGLEPPQYVSLFNTLMLTCFIKYLQNNSYRFILAVSLFVALITFVRFPSVFVWPVVILAVLLLRQNIKHTLTAALLPLLFFACLVSITNGSICGYFGDLTSTLHQSATDDHTIKKIFVSEIYHTIQLIKFVLVLSLPIILFAVCKIKKSIIAYLIFVIVAVILEKTVQSFK